MSNNNQTAAQSQRRIIEINHAISGVHGEELLQKANIITETRKAIMRRLEHKKKHSNILHDQLYQYLQKFPQQQSNLDQQVSTTKKNPIFEFDQKQKIQAPYIELKIQQSKYINQGINRFQKLGSFLKNANMNIDKIIES